MRGMHDKKQTKTLVREEEGDAARRMRGKQ